MNLQALQNIDANDLHIKPCKKKSKKCVKATFFQSLIFIMMGLYVSEHLAPNTLLP